MPNKNKSVLRSQTWGCCLSDDAKDGQYVTCALCNQNYHLDCLLLNRSSLPSNWTCSVCTTSVPMSAKDDSTPVRNVSTSRGSKRPALASPESGPVPVSSEEVRAIVGDVIKSEFSAMIKEMNSNMVSIVNRELIPLKQSLQSMNESMEFMNSRFEEIEAEQTDAKKNMKVLQSENLKMRTELNEVKQRLNNFEQQVRATNLELQCVPEHKQENLISIVNNLASSVGSTLNETSIMKCTRISKLNADSKRPRSIVLQLASPRVRNELLAATMTFNKSNPEDKLNTSHLGITGKKTPVYLVEHLSAENKTLHATTRKRAKEHGYKYVWVRDGKIYARKTDDSEYIYVKNTDCLNKII